MKTATTSRLFVSLTFLVLFGFWQLPQGQTQQNRNLDSTLLVIKSKVKDFEQDKNSIRQSLEWDKAKPWHIVFQQITSDSKGKSNTKSWEFNLANLDPNATRWQASGSKLTLVSRMERNQKLIRFLANGEPGPYTETIEIQFVEIEAVRSAAEDLKKAIQQAKPLWEKSTVLVAADLPSLTAVVAKAIAAVNFGKELGYRQDLKANPSYADQLELQVEELGSKNSGSALIYRFSVGDLNENGIKLVVSGSKLSLNLSTNGKQPFVEVVSDGKIKQFANEVELYLPDPETALLVQKALIKMMPLGAQVLKKRLQKYTTPTEILQTLKPLIKNTDKSKTPMEQALGGTLNERFSQSITNSKGGKVSTEFAFFWGDINEKSLNISAQGTQLALSFKTKEQFKFIEVKENNVLQNYRYELEFLFGDVEGLRQAEHLIANLLPLIKAETSAQNTAWMQKTLSELNKTIPELTQELKEESGPGCQWVITQIQSTEKGSKETKFQFGLKDIDPNLVKVEVRGKELYLDLQSKFRQKVISKYVEGKVEYTSNCSLQFATVADLKTGRATLLKLIEGCK